MAFRNKVKTTKSKSTLERVSFPTKVENKTLLDDLKKRAKALHIDPKEFDKALNDRFVKLVKVFQTDIYALEQAGGNVEKADALVEQWTEEAKVAKTSVHEFVAEMIADEQDEPESGNSEEQTDTL